MKTFFLVVLNLLALLESCNARGAPWDEEEEFKIIAKKVVRVIRSQSPEAEFRKKYKGYKRPGAKFGPSSRKVIFFKDVKKRLFFT